MTFQLIRPFEQDLWKKMMDLRYLVLRQPWGEPKGSEQADDDDSSLHGILRNDAFDVLGTCRSHLVEPGVAQFRFMAISPGLQGKGLGKTLVSQMEAATLNEFKNINKIILHAREPAVPFYTLLNYKTIEPSYLLFGSIPHFLMEKRF